MAFISILARSVFSFVLLLILSKITGKRQISQLTFYDYTTAVTIGSIAAALAVEEDVDVLFAAVKVGRFCGIDPEEAITLTCEKFIRRFRAMEQAALERGQSLEQLSLDEMTALWNGAKHS